jgi:hypothetical protein
MQYVTRTFWMFAIIAALMTALLGSSAHAQLAARGDSSVGWCAIQARLTVKSFSLIIDKSRGDGYGRIVCEYADGSEEILPIRVKTKGMGVGVNFPKVYQETTAKMMASGFGVAGGGAQALIGTYVMGQGGAHIANVGGDLGINMTANRHGFSIPLTLQTANARRNEEAVGFGLDVGYMQISIDPNNTQARHMNKLPLRRPVARPMPTRPMMPVARPAVAPAPVMAAPVARPAVSVPQERLNVPPVGTGDEISGSSDGQVSENAPQVDEATPDQVAQSN